MRQDFPGTSARTRRCGMTLMELLVVIAIVMLLLALLMPGLARARHLSRITQCGANLRQFATTLVEYAQEHPLGMFPSGDANQGVAKPQNNLWDVPGSFLDILINQYKQPRAITVCPETDVPAFIAYADGVLASNQGIQGILGYGYWVPRIGTGDEYTPTVFPPPPDRSNPFYHYSPDPSIRPQQGPTRTTDRVAESVPILSDAVFANFNDDVGDPSYPTRLPSMKIGLSKWATHTWGGIVDFQNRAYADGHVDRVPVTQLRPTYNLKYYSPYRGGESYPSWNWQ